jgi:hypothetical protein
MPLPRTGQAVEPEHQRQAAALHLAYAVADQATWSDVIGDGLWDAVEPDAARESELWFLVLSPALFALGAVARNHVRATGELPASLGVWLVVTGLLISVLVPLSGGWVILATGVLTLAAAREPTPGSPSPPATSTTSAPATPGTSATPSPCSSDSDSLARCDTTG